MDSATYGLIGAALGATAALNCVFLTHRFTERRETGKDERETWQERDRWLRDQKQNCYHNTVRSLVRLRTVGAQTKNTATLKLPTDVPASWYDDVAEANSWFASLHNCCGEKQYDRLGEALAEFANLSRWLIGFRPSGTISSKQFQHIFSGTGSLDVEQFVDLLSDIENSVSNCAREEFQLAPTLNTVGHSNKRLERSA